VRSGRYVPALSYHWMTRFYDPVARLTTREKTFKNALVMHSGIKDEDDVLDLACGTGTLTILLKRASPLAEVTGIDGDPQILDKALKKASKAGLGIRFDEGMSFDLPYRDESFDRVVSSLFFHHLTRENKLKTLFEVKRVLKPRGELHVADWGSPASSLMKFSSRFIQALDGLETTADSFGGLLPEFMARAGLAAVEETGSFNTLFGTIRLHKALNS